MYWCLFDKHTYLHCNCVDPIIISLLSMDNDSQTASGDDDKSEKSDVRNVPKSVLKEFIEMYRAHPALWQIKNKDLYNNRNLKNKGYKELLEIWRKYDAEADQKTVKNKIQSLRGSFRKELKKVGELYRLL